MCHLATDLPWTASDPSWTSVLRVYSSDADSLGRAARGRPGDLPLDPPLPEKVANATGFYCDTQNFIAICRFSATAGDFGCVRVTCCNQNLSVAIKILLVAISTFSTTAGDFGCVRVTFCNQNLSVAIKILLDAINRRYHNAYF